MGAYELGISDWSSDVCSSNLELCNRPHDEIADANRRCARDRDRDRRGPVGRQIAKHEALPGYDLGEVIVVPVEEHLRVADGLGARIHQRFAVMDINLHLRCARSEEHTSELQSLMRISYAVFCLKKHNTSQF